MRRIGEAVEAGRQQSRQQARPEQIAGLAGFVFQAEQDLRDPVHPRPASVRQLPGLAAKPLANANCRACAGRPLQIVSHVALVAKAIGMAEMAGGAVSNAEDMLVSVSI